MKHRGCIDTNKLCNGCNPPQGNPPHTSAEHSQPQACACCSANGPFWWMPSPRSSNPSFHSLFAYQPKPPVCAWLNCCRDAVLCNALALKVLQDEVPEGGNWRTLQWCFPEPWLRGGNSHLKAGETRALPALLKVNQSFTGFISLLVCWREHSSPAS